MVPADEQVTEPYWLRRERTRDQYDWDATMPRTLPFAPPRLSANVDLVLAGETVTLKQRVEFRFSDKTFGEIRTDLKVVPALTLSLRPNLLIIPSGSQNRTRDVAVEVTHNARSSRPAR
jgi:hypothetical protein